MEFDESALLYEIGYLGHVEEMLTQERGDLSALEYLETNYTMEDLEKFIGAANLLIVAVEQVKAKKAGKEEEVEKQ